MHAILICLDELAHIETFDAVARTRSFTEAARELGLPQPLVSRRVKALERRWGGLLFERESRVVQLTALAELTLPYARDVLLHAHHLHDALVRVRESVVHVVAVPEGCPAAALAAVITAGAARDIPVAVRECPPGTSADGLASGRHAAALVRAAPQSAALRVVTGLAGADERFAGQPLHLDVLRPRRGTGAGRGPIIRLTGEDAPEPFAGALRRAVARAGLPEARVQVADSLAAGVAMVLAEGGFVCCDARAARRDGLHWRPFADAALHRGYELRLAAGSRLRGADRSWLTPLLADAVGAVGPGSPAGPIDTGEAPGDDRLAAAG